MQLEVVSTKEDFKATVLMLTRKTVAFLIEEAPTIMSLREEEKKVSAADVAELGTEETLTVLLWENSVENMES